MFRYILVPLKLDAANKTFVIAPAGLGRLRAPQYWRYVQGP